MMQRKAITVLLAVVFALNTATPAFAASKTLTLTNAIKYAQANFPDIRSKKNELASKRIELVDAIEEIRQARRKQNAIKFSLLFNLQFPEKTTLNKEYDLISKTPKLEADIRIINKELQDLQVEAAYQAVQKYGDVYVLERQLEFDEKRLEQTKKDFAATKLRAISGLGTQDDADALDAQVKALTSAVSTGRLKVKNARETLGGLLNMDLHAYTLTNPFVIGSLSRDRLEDAVKYGLERNVELYVADSEVNYTSYCVRLLDALYTQKWGGKINIVRPYMYGPNVDTANFQLVYEYMRRQIDAPWDGEYKIWLLFFTLRIPKEWFKGSRDGLRYFSDGQYPLVEAVIDRESALETQRQTKTRLRKEIIDTYELMLQAYTAYTAAVSSTTKNKYAFDKIMVLNKSGLASQSEVSAARDNYEESQISELEILAAYNSIISLFNRKSGGYLKDVVEGKTSFDAVGAGISYSHDGAAQSGKFFFNTVVRDFTDSFKITLPSGFDATDFELWHETRWRVGKRTPVSAELVHIHSAFQGDEGAILYLFNDGKLIATAVIDTQKQSGTYVLQLQTRPDTQPAPKVLGTFTVRREEYDIISDISVAPAPALKAASYNISDTQGTMLLESEPIPVGQEFTYISVGTLPINELIVCFYDEDGKPLAKASMDSKSGRLIETESGGGQ